MWITLFCDAILGKIKLSFTLSLLKWNKIIVQDKSEIQNLDRHNEFRQIDFRQKIIDCRLSVISCLAQIFVNGDINLLILDW